MINKNPAPHYLFFIAQNYSFEILRPLQQLITAQGGQVLWFVYGDEVTLSHFKPSERYTTEAREAVNFNPTATYVPGNIVPSFIPGLKVQIFHGLEWKKKGHFVIRGCFDLYCPHGPATTGRFKELAKQHGYFDVVETGWPKLDTLFSSAPYQWPEQTEAPVILFAPTFSPALTSVPALYDEIVRLAKSKPWQWVIKFHPKMDPQWVAKYKALALENLHVVEDTDVAHILQAADVMVSDTSSIIGEFALLGKPAVTLNNSQPGDYLIDINAPEGLEAAIELGLSPSTELSQHIVDYAQGLHPYNDGNSSQRVLDATHHMLEHGRGHLKKKPLNIFRNLKMRRKLGYWS
ncbi:CDP-glycerol glycerophosphotransferase family protein [Psychrobium sp. 1_MG-2023]|uniref:CDP-glycerol glycerophosphotransferase family protein n=1 Tax=Psychrobium sp. 1_MG-2023 TaxID=3062624 RepID=UPI000C31CDE1|nr:CDP-glycerol glycerophosphotransferase family protein [Psychrobium sp. 1_MG-2023]MDP2562535.1 CDP-glycerol glycerophosphotransferase family protein [Psychrobium sp. 1_MG-2023]PKF57973.1 CDP-glycerol--glycerophosphate glycerophosphotransferase [Alteromonadales bacterium alter-6D02]